MMYLLLTLSLYAHNPNITAFYSRIYQRVESNHQRAATLRSYLESKNSPLAGSAETFIRVSDENELDWTLLPSIAGVESGFEKAGNTTDHNPFGYMCSGKPCVFASFDQGIETVGRSLGRGKAYKNYRESRSLLVLAIRYNQVSPEDWSGKVQGFQQHIETHIIRRK